MFLFVPKVTVNESMLHERNCNAHYLMCIYRVGGKKGGGIRVRARATQFKKKSFAIVCTQVKNDIVDSMYCC